MIASILPILGAGVFASLWITALVFMGGVSFGFFEDQMYTPARLVDRS